MNEKELFEAGCFLPSWTEDTESEIPISKVYTRKNKDLQTLLTELCEIKERLQDIQQRQWDLAKLVHYHKNNFAKD